MKLLRLFSLLLLAFYSCKNRDGGDALFVPVAKSHTGIDFRNLIVEKENFNIFKYQYFYNGSGLVVGDFNNDGRQDLFFTGNMVKNRLYLNKGNFEFEDISTHAHIYEKEGWCTGATPVDINADGWLDLYICRAGYEVEGIRDNLLYINNGAGADGKVTFTEKAAEYGLNDAAHATQASFFDYDLDGDLDLFLLNHSTVEYSRGSLDVMQLRKEKHAAFTNKLFRNDNQRFTDVTEAAGISGNVLSFSLGISIADINLDGWPDVFVANDFNEPDYLFMNQGNGTFRECATECFDHMSMFSMGTDVADFNGDALPDLVTLDMLPESNYLQKMHSGADNYDKVNLLLQHGFYRQYSRNMLHVNNGDGTFSELGQLAGMSNTDWSWSPLFFDFENDGDKDLFIANGYLRDHTDMDFLAFTADEARKVKNKQEHIGFQEYLGKMPPILQPNYFFENRGNQLPFVNATQSLGYPEASVTQSAAYADLDNDGDLDLVLNNSNDYATVLENRTEKRFPGNRHLRIQLKGNQQNPIGIGTKIYVYTGTQTQYLEQNPVRGFQSAMDPVLCLGLGENAQADSLRVIWPNGKQQVLKNVAGNQTLTLNINDAQTPWSYARASVQAIFTHEKELLDARHQENHFVDFKVQSLLPWFYSCEGPALATGDIDGDGWSDVFLGGAAGSPGRLFRATAVGWRPLSCPALESDATSEDVAACFFDADGDNDLDLYVASGGFEFAPDDPALTDRLYINSGNGNFSRAKNLPADRISDRCVAAADADADGDLDLFLGALVTPQRFPEAPPSRLLLNDGKGNFNALPVGTNALVKAALWTELDGGKTPELIVASEWGSLQVFKYDGGQMQDISSRYFSKPCTGLWQSLQAGDFDGDGDMDLVAGNLGLNSQLQASETLPLSIYYEDFDKNGSIDPLICYPVQGVSYPLASREDLLIQIPPLKKRFLHFKDYALAGIKEVAAPVDPAKLRQRHVSTLESCYFENKNGHFEKHLLPLKAQYAPVCAIVVLDVDGDKNLDLVLAGNMLQNRVKLGSLDGLHGLVLRGDGKGQFNALPDRESGLMLGGAVRGIQIARTPNGKKMLFGINNEAVQVYGLK